MANDEAWQAGVDIASKKKKKDAGTSTGDKMGAKKGIAPKTSDGANTPGGAKSPWSILRYIPKLHSGGKVKRTGNYRLRKGEVVMTVSQQKAAGIKKGKKKAASHKRVASKR